MSIQTQILELIRNFLYRLHHRIELRFNQVNRTLLRKVTPGIDPIEDAVSITDRHSGSEWKHLQPVWVISTGRTGTNTMTELFSLSPKITAYHEPSPELFQFSYDYHMGHLDRKQAIQALMYLRDEPVFRSYRDGFVYVETNNRVTYIADLLLELFPGSRFIHVYRNPYDFIRSGMRRIYYQGHLRDSTRITPRPSDPFSGEWENFSPIEKVAWYWAAVNDTCIGFMNQVPEQQKMSISSEQFFQANPALIRQLFDFIGSVDYHPPASVVDRVMGTKHNAQREGAFSRPKDWTDEQVVRVDRIIAPVADQLSYSLITQKRAEQNLHLK